jgi:hypothetical protein
MCVNCLTQAEVAAANVAVTAAVLRAPVHRLLADAGLVAPPDPVARDVRTVAFLRSLDLDAADVLGADVVARADARVAGAPSAQPAPASIRRSWARRSASPMRSHSALTVQ